MKAIREARISGSAKALTTLTRQRSTKVRIEPVRDESLRNRAIHPEQALRCEPTYPVAAISNTYGVGFLKKRRTSSAESI